MPASHDADLRAVGQTDGAISTHNANGESSRSISRLSYSLNHTPSSRSSNNETESSSSPPRVDSPDSADGIFVPILSTGSSSARNSTYISSPLNPTASPEPPYHKGFNSLGRRSLVARLPSEDARALGNSSPSSRNSMILYHLANTDDGPLPSPPRIHAKRESVASESGDSIVSLSADSKYPSGSLGASERGLVAYAYDPELDDGADDDWEYDAIAGKRGEIVSARAIINLGGLVILFLIAMGLFLVFPIAAHGDDEKNWLIAHNPKINSTGQAQEVFDVTATDDRGNGRGGGNEGDGRDVDGVTAGKRRRNQTPAFDSVRVSSTGNRKRNQTPAFDYVSSPIDPSTPVKARKVILPRSRNIIYDLVFSRERYSLCGSSSIPPFNEHLASHLVEIGNQDGSRSFWQNGVWERVFDADLLVPRRLTVSLPRRRYAELDMDQICNDKLQIEYIRIYQVS
ncbi:hypothetical protein PM082_001891 [Marasmius tenuissimus]|nr:hypothetical protein PM082_001891 [Marasmius tenuissimus]